MSDETTSDEQELSRSDMRMITKSIRLGWDIPEKLLESLPKVVGMIAMKGNPREQIAAARVLVAMQQSNVKANEVKLPSQTTVNVGVNVDARIDERRNRTLAIAQRIRADRVLSVDSE